MDWKRIAASALMLGVLAVPASAASITPQTTMKEIRDDPDIKASGLYTYTYVKEDAFLLYGFLSRSDLEMFKLCITVSGIGPKGALAILSVMDADSLRFAIMSGDTKAISKAPGVGTRTAQRLILELKDKISIDDTLISREIAAGGAEGILTAGSLHIDSEKKKEAVEALVALGYGQAESLKAVNAIEDVEAMDSGAILKAALKKLF